jgi:hypothetical protein
MSAHHQGIEIEVLGLMPMRLEASDVERLREQSLPRLS